ncbi:glycoside hydrolase family 28 protein [Quadrisphaera oryzae]|uniref:glycoside hydrolase family 28 protein n=1 Tax=Quadrisphaera TaxID=317661 RepID=UPI001C96D83A
MIVDAVRAPGLAAAAVVVLLVLAGCTGTGSSTTTGDGVPGDRRHVVEPTAPATTCATVTAQVAMTGREASPADEAAPPDTGRLQQALDRCAQRGDGVVAVRLTAGASSSSFLSGPLTVRRGEVLLLDPGTTLDASRDAADYQAPGQPTCGTVARGGGSSGCRPFITLRGGDDGLASTRAADGTQGRVDGRGDLPVLGTTTSWWQLAAAAKGSGEQQQVPRLVESEDADDVVLHDVDLVDSPGFNVSDEGGDGFTAWGVRIDEPATARNTDGIDPAGATDVTITDSWIADGDDGVAVKGGSAPSSHITVSDDHFYGTHGISLGSETTAGISHVLVADDTVSGTDPSGTPSADSAGIRIKSDPKAGGVVDDVVYRDVCVAAVKAPIDVDPRYGDPSGPSESGAHVPWFTGIAVDGLTAVGSPAGATSTLAGYDDDHPLGLTLTGVSVDAPHVVVAHAHVTASGTTFGGAPLPGAAGAAVAPSSSSSGAAPACTFPAYPAL